MSNIADFEIENGKLIKYHGNDREVTVPDSVTRIEKRAFYECESMVSVVIPDSVTRIGDFAFNSCYNLKTVIFKGNLPAVGYGTFYSCFNLTAVAIYNSGGNKPASYLFNRDYIKTLICTGEQADALSFYTYNMEGDRDEFIDCRPKSLEDAWERILRDSANEWRNRFIKDYGDESPDEWFKYFRHNHCSEECRSWLETIEKYTSPCLRAMKNNLDFYNFVIERKWINADNVDEIIGFTDSLECRALLLEYKKNY